MPILRGAAHIGLPLQTRIFHIFKILIFNNLCIVYFVGFTYY